MYSTLYSTFSDLQFVVMLSCLSQFIMFRLVLSSMNLFSSAVSRLLLVISEWNSLYLRWWWDGWWYHWWWYVRCWTCRVVGMFVRLRVRSARHRASSGCIKISPNIWCNQHLNTCNNIHTRWNIIRGLGNYHWIMVRCWEHIIHNIM